MQQIDFIRYELATGKIVSSCSCPEYAYAANTPPSTEIGYLNGTVTDINAYYILNETITECPTLNLPETPIQLQANGVDSFELTDLPQGTSAIISFEDEPDNEAYEINDGELSFSTEQPGIYTIRINAFPYREATVTIEATL